MENIAQVEQVDDAGVEVSTNLHSGPDITNDPPTGPDSGSSSGSSSGGGGGGGW
jgi:hypothetical protein